jgi:hypothetical protein
MGIRKLPIYDCQLPIGNEMGVTRRIVRAGGWKVAKRIIKPIPIIGSVFAFGLAGYEIKKKGLIPGAVHVGLDVTPVIGTAKGVVEIFTGDLIPDKKDRGKNRQNGKPFLPPKAK